MDKHMRIIGIDPGTAITGYGIVEKSGYTYRSIQHGVIETKAGLDLSVRLSIIYDALRSLLKEFTPEAAVVEELFFNTNAKTAISVGQARGVILLAIFHQNVPLFEYTPLEVKNTLVGYGRAQKDQIQKMVKMRLGLQAIPKPDDAADGLALALCHFDYSRGTKYIQKG